LHHLGRPLPVADAVQVDGRSVAVFDKS